MGWQSARLLELRANECRSYLRVSINEQMHSNFCSPSPVSVHTGRTEGAGQGGRGMVWLAVWGVSGEGGTH